MYRGENKEIGIFLILTLGLTFNSRMTLSLWRKGNKSDVEAQGLHYICINIFAPLKTSEKFLQKFLSCQFNISHYFNLSSQILLSLFIKFFFRRNFI